jgi:small subunit ribosomal protein S18
MAIIKSSDSGSKPSGGAPRGDRGDRGDRGGRDDRDGGFDKDGDGGGRRGGGGGGFHRKKVCRFCSDQDFIMDYKDQRMMQSFVTEHGKIVPRRISGNCAKHQRHLTTDVKRARNLALVGFVSSGADYR